MNGVRGGERLSGMWRELEPERWQVQGPQFRAAISIIFKGEQWVRVECVKERAVGLRWGVGLVMWDCLVVDGLICYCKYFGFYFKWDVKPLEGFSRKMAWSYVCLNRISLQATLKTEWIGRKSRSSEASLCNDLGKRS